jgi:hypothetical protein
MNMTAQLWKKIETSLALELEKAGRPGPGINAMQAADMTGYCRGLRRMYTLLRQMLAAEAAEAKKPKSVSVATVGTPEALGPTDSPPEEPVTDPHPIFEPDATRTAIEANKTTPAAAVRRAVKTAQGG